MQNVERLDSKFVIRHSLFVIRHSSFVNRSSSFAISVGDMSDGAK